MNVLPLSGAWFAGRLSCPDCGSELRLGSPGINCTSCSFRDATGRDLRRRSRLPFQITVQGLLPQDYARTLEAVDTSSPAVTYGGPAALRDSGELMSELSLRVPPGGQVLDLGCGPRDQFTPLDYLGYKYVGIDFSSKEADLLGDAHAIPFRPGSFGCVFSYAVLEHLSNPFIAIREIERVLRPGGFFIGTVAQGEPFHDSFFHHTPWGLVSLIASAQKLSLIRLWSSGDTLRSLGRIGRYPRPVKSALSWLAALDRHAPWLAPRRMRWTQKQKELDRLYRAASLCFVVMKDGKP